MALGELQEKAGAQFDPNVVQALLFELGEEKPVVSDEGYARDDSAMLRKVADELGAEDLFVFRKVSPEKYTHFGGIGRGQGWAGNVELHSHEEGHFRSALESGQPVCLDFSGRERVVGPYYARSALIIPCRGEMVVVLGSSTDTLVSPDLETATALAEGASAVVEQISPEKRLADELEVLEAVRNVMSISGRGSRTPCCAWPTRPPPRRRASSARSWLSERERYRVSAWPTAAGCRTTGAWSTRR